MKIRMLDLFCGAGGCAVVSHRAAKELGIELETLGVDLKPQPRYPFEFVQGDALEYGRSHGHEFDCIHASPPCQQYSKTRAIHGREYPDLVGPTRDVLTASGAPYVIENVPGAPLRDWILLCGTMFGLRLYRHRKFELAGFWCLTPTHPGHTAPCAKVGRRAGPGEFVTVAGHCNKGDAALAMGIDWMLRDELAQAIPPAYTHFIGLKLLRSVAARRAAWAT